MPETQPSKSEARKHYFVDEAGDAVLFGSRGKVLIGSDGCSRFFMLGLLDVLRAIATKLRREAAW